MLSRLNQYVALMAACEGRERHPEELYDLLDEAAGHLAAVVRLPPLTPVVRVNGRVRDKIEGPASG